MSFQHHHVSKAFLECRSVVIILDWKICCVYHSNKLGPVFAFLVLFFSFCCILGAQCDKKSWLPDKICGVPNDFKRIEWKSPEKKMFFTLASVQTYHTHCINWLCLTFWTNQSFSSSYLEPQSPESFCYLCSVVFACVPFRLLFFVPHFSQFASFWYPMWANMHCMWEGKQSIMWLHSENTTAFYS